MLRGGGGDGRGAADTPAAAKHGEDEEDEEGEAFVDVSDSMLREAHEDAAGEGGEGGGGGGDDVGVEPKLAAVTGGLATLTIARSPERPTGRSLAGCAQAAAAIRLRADGESGGGCPDGRRGLLLVPPRPPDKQRLTPSK